jgi:aminopeptidase N
VLGIDRISPEARELVLDTRALDIHEVEAAGAAGAFAKAAFEVGENDAILGAPLRITLPPDTNRVKVHYSTHPEASGLQWLTPEQTAGKKQPFLYSQSEAIHARSWIPLQDTPGVRVTYSATVRTPKDLVAVMSAEMDPGATENRTGVYQFQMPQRIPSYLIALAVGDLQFRAMSERTGVYAEPSVVAQAANEFDDTEKMMEAVEKLYGPYRWGRYDILVLPPSFPFGGMENPRLTFATPTILAGDKSLVSLVAHELAHSWSGNLVTNATWSDFWLNEGFTVYLESRIQEEVFGKDRAEMETALEVQELKQEMAGLDPVDQVLHVDLAGRDPDAGFTLVPYNKGRLFLLSLEEAVGREKFDSFLRSYFDHFAFQSITTSEFRAYLDEHLLRQNPDVASKVPIEAWIEEPGMPSGAPEPVSQVFVKVDEAARNWLTGKSSANKIPAGQWTTQEWLHFLRALPEKLERKQMEELDRTFHLTRSGNAEIASQWLLMAIRNHYDPAYPRVENFLVSVGRRKFLKPLYTELVKTPEGKERARAIYKKARPGYHPIAAATIDEIVKP